MNQNTNGVSIDVCTAHGAPACPICKAQPHHMHATPARLVWSENADGKHLRFYSVRTGALIYSAVDSFNMVSRIVVDGCYMINNGEFFVQVKSIKKV